MTKEDYNIIEHLVSLKEADMNEKDQAQRIIRTYMDPGYKLCLTCAPQVVLAFKRIRTWWAIEKPKWNFEEKKKKK